MHNNGFDEPKHVVHCCMAKSIVSDGTFSLYFNIYWCQYCIPERCSPPLQDRMWHFPSTSTFHMKLIILFLDTPKVAGKSFLQILWLFHVQFREYDSQNILRNPWTVLYLHSVLLALHFGTWYHQIPKIHCTVLVVHLHPDADNIHGSYSNSLS